jgi:hypothetical protein
MKAKMVVGGLLAGFAVVSLAFVVVGELRSEAGRAGGQGDLSSAGAAKTPAAAESGTRAMARPTHRIVVYFFHGNTRCATCRRIEEYAHEAVRTTFRHAIEDGRVEWRVANMQTSGNEHFIKDYELYSSSVVVVEFRDDQQTRWNNLEKVWQLVDDKAAFTTFVCDAVREYLGADG